jgi:hypothetical protein
MNQIFLQCGTALERSNAVGFQLRPLAGTTLDENVRPFTLPVMPSLGFEALGSLYVQIFGRNGQSGILPAVFEQESRGFDVAKSEGGALAMPLVQHRFDVRVAKAGAGLRDPRGAAGPSSCADVWRAVCGVGWPVGRLVRSCWMRRSSLGVPNLSHDATENRATCTEVRIQRRRRKIGDHRAKLHLFAGLLCGRVEHQPGLTALIEVMGENGYRAIRVFLDAA